MDVNQRLTKLRELMQRERLGAFIFPSTDPHNSEYVFSIFLFLDVIYIKILCIFVANSYNMVMKL